MLGAVDELRQLVEKRQIKKVIDSYPLFRSATKGGQDSFEKQVQTGEIELEAYPMGTLAEKYTEERGTPLNNSATFLEEPRSKLSFLNLGRKD